MRKDESRLGRILGLLIVIAIQLVIFVRAVRQVVRGEPVKLPAPRFSDADALETQPQPMLSAAAPAIHPALVQHPFPGENAEGAIPEATHLGPAVEVPPPKMAEIALPQPTYWPVVLSVGVGFVLWGAVSTFLISILGVAFVALAAAGWVWELSQ